MIRLYLSKMRGDGLTPETAYRAAFMDLLPKKPKKVAMAEPLIRAGKVKIDNEPLAHAGPKGVMQCKCRF